MTRRAIRWTNHPSHARVRRPMMILACIAFLVFAAGTAAWLGGWIDPLNRMFLAWGRGDQEQRAQLVTVQRDACAGAPFTLPSDGFIGLLYADPRGPYSRSRPHQGIDIFSNNEPGVTPVFAAYGGYITREPEWRSSLIIRVPDDPLQEGRQIWLYYTHMADREGNDFIEEFIPPGTRELFVEQGTLLGYTGDYNGNSRSDIWVHLHFSIVMDDGEGGYRNELEFDNTLDPSPYLGLPVRHGCAPADYAEMVCTADPCG